MHRSAVTAVRAFPQPPDASMEPEAAANVWAPAIYDTSKSPTLEATLNIESDPKFLNNFPRNAKWSVRLYNPGSTLTYFVSFPGLPMALLFFLNARIGPFKYLIREP